MRAVLASVVVGLLGAITICAMIMYLPVVYAWINNLTGLEEDDLIFATVSGVAISIGTYAGLHKLANQE